MKLVCRDKVLDLSAPVVMGVLNVTPDSFSDGGRVIDVVSAISRARDMAAEGAAIIDVGGESTRPGAQPVGTEEEMRRVLPVIEGIADLPVVVSVDTRKPEVMRAACKAGAGMINDVFALRAPGALRAAAECAVPVCLMHMQGEPQTMQNAPEYGDVVGEVRDFLAGRIDAAVDAGIPRTQIVIDPGFGFGKSLEHNLQLLANLGSLSALARPVLVGISRKAMLGAILSNAPAERRLEAGLAAACLAAWQGASILRTHDVRQTVDAVRTVASVGKYRRH
jgi:dihydropteroate synthase